ncbi:MAG: chloride channel protein [Bacteroidales bacterium]|jgi:CIC family chloride channel protein|nr:chloride channel protein [Bacteroidales bacterium]
MKKFLQIQKALLDFIRNIKQRQLILGLSLIIGLLSGGAAILLKNLTHFVEYRSKTLLLGEGHSNISVILPLVGIIITVLFVSYILKQDIGHGVSKILFSISKRKGHLKPHNTWSSMLASSITVGLGGSVGLEAPIVLTGASIGSNIGRILRLNYKTVILLIGCGSAGAIAGIFKAPIAGLIFAFEVLMLELTAWSIVPLLISSVTAATVSSIFLGDKVVFAFTISEPFALSNLPFYILLGLFTGLVSLYFTRMNMWVEHSMGLIKNNLVRTLTGGLLLCALIFVMPHLFGEGYTTLKTLLTGQSSELFNNTVFENLIQNNSSFIILFFLMLVIFKVIAMALTTGSGGVGGIFAPALFVGGMSGVTLSKTINIFSGTGVSDNNFALVGMAGVMSGVMHAPLTAIFLIAEITGGYALFIPLIITATISYVTILIFEKQSIYTKRLSQRGELMTHNKDNNILSMLSVVDVIENDCVQIPVDGHLGDLVKAISKSKRNIFPVINEHQELVGVISLNDVRDIIFNTELYEKTRITEIMLTPPAIIDKDEDMKKVLEIFEKTEAWNLPVTDNKKYLGFISRSKIFNSYRGLLKEFSDD